MSCTDPLNSFMLCPTYYVSTVYVLSSSKLTLSRYGPFFPSSSLCITVSLTVLKRVCQREVYTPLYEMFRFF